MVWMLGCLTLSQRSHFFLFFFPCFFIYFHHSIFQLTYPFFCLIYYTVGSIQSVLISMIALFITDLIFFFISSLSLSNISYLFSICVSSLFICISILFSRFLIIFAIIILNSLSGRLPISSSFVWFGGFLSCSFIWWIFLCLFILFTLLCLGSPFAGWRVIVSLNCGVSSLWVGLDQWLVKISWLGKLMSVFWWMELDLISLEDSTVSNSEFWCVYGFAMAFGSVSF